MIGGLFGRTLFYQQDRRLSLDVASDLSIILDKRISDDFKMELLHQMIRNIYLKDEDYCYAIIKALIDMYQVEFPRIKEIMIIVNKDNYERYVNNMLEACGISN